MQRNFAFLCDAAQESGGKLHALGIGINRVFGQELPVSVPRIVLVAQLQYNASEAGSRQMRLQVLDADGTSIMQPAEGTIALPIVSDVVGEREATATANVIVSLESPKFSAYGLYEVRLAVDGNDVATLPLQVVQWQVTPGAG